MRIVIDLQGAQTESRFRGIGRYSLSLTQAIVRNAGRHEILIALSGLFPETIEPIRDAFHDVLSRESIRVWHAPGPTRELDDANSSRRQIAERVREAFLLSLEPDIVLVTSLFEGLGDDAVVSIGEHDSRTPTAAILYDLIPLISPDIHFQSSRLHQEHYSRKIASLKRARHLLAISDSARQEALSALPFQDGEVTNVSGACDVAFRRIEVSDADRRALNAKLGITRPFVMYTGGADERKNLRGLITAYSDLPLPVRRAHQLVLAGRMPDGEVKALLAHADACDLAADETLFTGYIADDELLKLYNTCRLFIFPSLHEGFGLPPLEAMACGAAVIAANRTSLPEVIGDAEAMFDPDSTASIRDKLLQALTDEAFRDRLLDNAARQAQAFSWDRSAKVALATLERFDPKRAQSADHLPYVERTTVFEAVKKRILLLKLDHFGDLLLAIPAIAKVRARYPASSLEIAVGSWNAELANTLPFFEKIHLLDYFKQKSAGKAELALAELESFADRLGEFDIAIDLRRQADTRFVLANIRAALKVGYRTFDSVIDKKLDIALDAEPDVPFVETSLNRMSISNQMLALIDALPGNPNDFVSLPPLGRHAQPVAAKAVALFPYAGNDVKEWDILRYQELAFELAQSGFVDEVNLYFSNAAEAARHPFPAHPRIFSHAGLKMTELIDSVGSNRVCVANNSGGAHLAAYLGLIVIGVYGGHETAKEWAPVFGESYVVHRDAHCSPCHIASRGDCRNDLYCLGDIPVEAVFGRVREALQTGNDSVRPAITLSAPPPSGKSIVTGLLESISPLLGAGTERELALLARDIASSIPTKRVKSLFVDISQLVHHDSKTGIQRVTRSVLRELLASAPADYEIIPVYANFGTPGYWRANEFIRKFNGNQALDGPSDEPIDFRAGDIFLGLDLQPEVIPNQREFLARMHRDGVLMLFVLHDLLCIRMQQHFPRETSDGFLRWLWAITDYDGALCVSRAVADDLKNWVEENRPERTKFFEIDWFHNGADIESSSPTRGLPANAQAVLARLAARPSFLVVGTIEPRKGHLQVLNAFDRLWAEGTDVNLVIVGKKGWMVDEVAARLDRHAELGKRVFWIEGASDEYLEKIYSAATCLIAASEGEGFGLPLIEAARQKLPVIARDLPVFREVAGTHAYYFHGLDPRALSEAIKSWLALFATRSHPKSDAMPWLTWRQTTAMILSHVLRSAQAPRSSDGVAREHPANSGERPILVKAH